MEEKRDSVIRLEEELKECRVYYYMCLYLVVLYLDGWDADGEGEESLFFWDSVRYVVCVT